MDLELLTEQPAAGAHATPILFVHGAYHGAWTYRHWLPYFADHGYWVNPINFSSTNNNLFHQ